MLETALNMSAINEGDLRYFLSYINCKKGVDLSSYNSKFILRRLGLRMSATHIESCRDYINLILRKPEEFNLFLDALSINVSKFFRDPEVFAAFRKIALSDIIRRKKATHQRTIRAWSAGCSLGEEAYSLAIIMKEEFQKNGDNFIGKVWATDVDNHALEKAKIGEYEPSSLEEVSPQQLEKYFIQVSSGNYRAKDDIKQMVKFVKHNLISDPPLKCMDIIFCRNVLIYLIHQQHELLFEVFNQALNPKGYLVTGKVEGIWGHAKNLLTAVDASGRIYQKVK